MVRFVNLKTYTIDLHVCYLCVDQNIKYLNMNFCMFVGYIVEYIQIVFSFFLTKKMIF
jgi:hypothetical protein